MPQRKTKKKKKKTQKTMRARPKTPMNQTRMNQAPLAQEPRAMSEQIARARAFATLIRYLGPWSGANDFPRSVRRRYWLIRDGALQGHRAFIKGIPEDSKGELGEAIIDAYIYEPAAARGAPIGVFIVAPGLHFAGPDDPRFDRFCRVIAGAGFVVVAPFLPDYVNLRVRPSALDDFERVLEACAQRFPALMPAVVFSISFGSWIAIELASKRPDLVGELITFGGYAEFDAIARFCVSGEVEHEGKISVLPNDPLNSPALFINLLDALGVHDERPQLEHSFRRMCYRTWGKMELKAPGRLAPIVDEMIHLAPARHRDLFRVIAGAEPGTVELLRSALAAREGLIPEVDPDEALTNLKVPFTIAHSRDDDVIPFYEAYKLKAGLPEGHPVGVHLTGLYTHSGQGVGLARGAAREVKTLLELAQAFANAGSSAAGARR